MFENLNGWEFVALILLALLIFGDRLPTIISDGVRMLRNLRAMARNATGDLSRELGTDIQLEDLHPKTFIRKHLLSEADEEALRRPLQGVFNDLRDDLKGVQSEFKDVADGISGRSGPSSAPEVSSTESSPTGSSATGSSSVPAGPGGGSGATNTPARARFDSDAT